jgi:hypothetical protein
MHDIGEGTIRRIDWTELTPVVLLLRIFNVALGMRILFLALVGVCLTTLVSASLGISFMEQGLTELFRRVEPEFRFVPLGGLYRGIHEVGQSSFTFLWLFAVVIIWTICGGLICRIVAVRLTVDESESTKNLLLFYRKRGIGFTSSLVLLLLGILGCYLPVKIAALLATVPGLNYVVAVLFPIPLLFAFFTVILALGLAVGWMLLFAAVSVDGSDGFDAISRMFSYVFQRPLHYILYWIFSGVLGYLGFLLVMVLAATTATLCRNVIPATPGFLDSFWLVLVLSLPTAYVFAWFWTSSVAIYLLLRRSVDATPFNEVYRVEPPKVRSLPTIKQDEHGAPAY